MNRTQFFTDAIAAELRPALLEAGITLPVVGQVTDATPEGPRLEVRCEAAEEIVPGNYTMRLDCHLALTGLHAAEGEEETEGLLYRVADACWPVLSERARWKNRELPHPCPGSDPEYDAAPFIVLDLIAAPDVLNTEELTYVSTLSFRAFVQF